MSVAAIEELGSERYVIGGLTTDTHDDRPFIFRLVDGAPPEIGEMIALGVDDKAVHLFDRESGLRIGPRISRAPGRQAAGAIASYLPRKNS